MNRQDRAVLLVSQNSYYVRSEYKQLPAIHTQESNNNAGETRKMGKERVALEQELSLICSSRQVPIEFLLPIRISLIYDFTILH